MKKAIERVPTGFPRYAWMNEKLVSRILSTYESFKKELGLSKDSEDLWRLSMRVIFGIETQKQAMYNFDCTDIVETI